MNNTDIKDQDIVDIVHYLQNAFGKEGKYINSEEVKKLREDKPSGGLFTEKELLEKTFKK